MNRLKSDQKNKVRNFMQWTQSVESVAISFLTKSGWNLEYATQLYYDNPKLFDRSVPTVDRNKIMELFRRYCSRRDTVSNDVMGPNGVQSLLNDLRYDPCDRRVLLLACKFKAATQCEFSKDEWLAGMGELRVDTIDALREKLDNLNMELDTNKIKFRELYSFTFNYAKPTSHRNLDMETAIAYWQVIFHNQFPVFKKWEEFLRDEHKSGITRDTWNLLLDFVYTIKPDLSDYDEDGAWPVLIDQFVEYARNKYDLPKPIVSANKENNVYTSYY